MKSGVALGARVSPPLWPVTVEITVPWRDIDAAGHVNNAVYASYLETARMKTWLKAKGLDAPVVREPLKEIDIIFARLAIDYRSPAFLNETLVVSCWPGRVGDTSFALRYEVREKATGRLVAEAESVQVCFDWATDRKKRVPDDVRARLAAP